MFHKITYNDTKHFSKLIIDYLSEDDHLKPFINHFPSIKNFQKQIEEKRSQKIDRDILVNVLNKQNQSFNLSDSSKRNIALLKSNTTFSVTTGHQLCLFTGPLYFLYKIISVINLCDQLKVKYSSNNFVPVFWMASEDHDIDEINHINIYGNKIKWENRQAGPVGRMSLKGFESVISELRVILGSHKNADKLISLFERCYLDHNNLADATRFLVNNLFGEFGVVIIDGDDHNLKSQFAPYIKKDILENGFASTIRECSNRLSKKYKVQAFTRDINFFRLSNCGRNLIDSSVSDKEIEKHPERFSPNVLLRPIYQEIILPNLAYVGGQSEIAYWMQLKTAFLQEKIPFPILVLRNSFLLIDEIKYCKFEKLGFQVFDLFSSIDELNKKYILMHSNSDISLHKEKEDLNLLYENIASKNTDVGFQRSIKAQLHKHLHILEGIQEKIIRLEKQKSKSDVAQIAKIKKLLFPNNILQERHDNFITYYLLNGDNFIKSIKNSFDPLSHHFVILKIKNESLI